MKLSAQQITDIHNYLGKPLLHETAKFIAEHSMSMVVPGDSDEAMDEIVEAFNDLPSPMALVWHPVPTIDTTHITRLRVLADELRDAIMAVRKESTADRDELLDLSQVIRTDIGRVIAIAALSSPFESAQVKK